MKRKPLSPPKLNKVNVQREAKKEEDGGLFKFPNPWAQPFDHQHSILKNHQVYGLPLLPGLAYIDLLYQFFREKGHDFKDLELYNLAIHRPFVVGPNQRVQLSLRCFEMSAGKGWKIQVEGKDSTNSSDSELYVSGEMRCQESCFFDGETLDLPSLFASATSEVSLSEVYQQCRDQELTHTGLMQAEGRIYTFDEMDLIQATVPGTGLEGIQNFMFHPTLIDGSAIGTGGLSAPRMNGHEQRLFLPLFYESFRASELLQKGCITRIRKSLLKQKGELISWDMEFFNESGQKIGELKNFVNKLVRKVELINPNRTQTNSQSFEESNDSLHQPESIRVPETSVAAMQTSGSAEVSSGTSLADSPYLKNAEQLLKRILAPKLQKTEEEILSTVSYYEMGLDSAMLLDVVKEIEETLSISLTPILLFEYATVQELSIYLSENFSDQFQTSRPRSSLEVPTALTFLPEPPVPPMEIEKTALASVPDDQPIKHEVAIIGLAGKYPRARNIEAFWQNLLEGKDCITEIPKERWDWRTLEHLQSPSGKKMSKWGGFIDDPECFDPQFFRISPREAEILDPQERLFLETCWETIEDAGYTSNSLTPLRGKTHRRDVGVFVGVMHKDYTLVAAEAVSQGEKIPLSLNYASIANRVSYFCDFHGPSMAIDTVCSSSLTAIHLAIESIRRGESQVALAGGVNLSLHSNKYMTYGIEDLHSSDGYCHAFGEGGDGYVSAEGVGAILLKPLYQAVLDGDHIYAVIKGSVINHVGKVNGITVPSPVAQGDMIQKCFEQAGIDPRTISYIEAHGTGTSLGDPIEIQGLTKAFRQYTQDKQFCSIGSVKSNIGHAESAAGISGLTKVILQLYHKTFVPSLHSETINPHIDLPNSPFYVQHKTEAWPQPVIEENKKIQRVPRRAGISSFGATGSNAHLILEEYAREEKSSRVAPESPSPRRRIIPISAKNKKRLKEYAQRLLSFMQREEKTDEKVCRCDFSLNLDDIAYTLQVGRVAMEERLAFVVSSKEELCKNLYAFVNDGTSLDTSWQGQVKEGQSPWDLLESEENEKTEERFKKWVSQGKLHKIAELWVKGGDVNWESLYSKKTYDGLPRRISLPTYPFAKERYWIETKIRDSIRYPSYPQNKGDENSLPEFLYFEEVWQEQALTSVRSSVKTLLCFLSTSEKQQTFREVMKTVSPQTQIIFVEEGQHTKFSRSENYQVVAQDPKSFEQTLQKVQSEHNSVDGILYLWALEDTQYIKDSSPIVFILKSLASSKLQAEQILLVGLCQNALERCYLESWIGFQRSLGMLLPQTEVSVILEKRGADSANKLPMKDWTQRLWDEIQTKKSALKNDRQTPARPENRPNVLYENGKRHVCQIRPLQIESEQPAISPLKTGGTYLITGGAGGLGFLFAEYLLKRGAGKLVLTGRSSLNENQQAKIHALEKLGGKIFYLQGDICHVAEIKKGVLALKKEIGDINGAIHAAGIQGEKNIFEKSLEAFENVLSPKIQGSLALDEILKDEPLDFICYFSSSSAILGDLGSCDYAIGNRFQMAYAHYRNDLLAKGERLGKACVINWPLWKDGGMGVGENKQTEFYLKSSGQSFLEAEAGVKIFEKLLGQKETQHLVIVGQPSRVYRFLGITENSLLTVISRETQRSVSRETHSSSQGLSVHQRLEWDLKNAVNQVLKVPHEDVDIEANLADLGFDSVRLVEFAQFLTEHFGIEVTPATFFGYPTLEKLEHYFLEEHSKSIEAFYHEVAKTNEAAQMSVEESDPKEPSLRDHRSDSSFAEPIAIIGMSGQFPQANTVAQFWQNLRDGKNCITEFPSLRYAGPGAESAYQTVNPNTPHWGGFIADLDKFDPLFFEISPQEAEYMDPRQRLFLEEAWHAFEDAGYMGEHIKGTSCGVYVGVEEGDYGFLVGKQGQVNSNQNATLSARIAYLLDLKGPNLSLTAACSSGLVALHQASQALRQGDCSMALVGGISTIASPLSYLELNEAGMLSPDGKCYVFDQRANGLVPGEAVAVVLLKPLSNAIADKDHIYGCLKASGINYDGRTNDISAPSPLSQADLFKGVYEKYHINPENIQYVLAHSVGSPLGDPLEIQALTSVFGKYTDKKQYCSIGSIKPLIGHTFAASGVVSLIGMLLAMKHRTILASHNYKSSSGYIDFDETPFILNTENQSWATPNNQPRLGVISTTGISGTNAHAVIEEYCLLPEERASLDNSVPAPQIIVFSAKGSDQLLMIVQQFLEFLEIQKNEGHFTLSLPSLAYTLQTGREPLKERLALVAQSIEELQEKLKHFVSLTLSNTLTNPEHLDDYPIEHLYRGQVKRGKTRFTFEGIDDVQQQVDIWVNQKEYDKLLGLWVKGLTIDWNKLHGASKLPKMSLPTYPFARERYWMESRDIRESTPLGRGYLHPLLQENTSTLSEQRFSSTFSGEEFFLVDHQVNGEKVLPGVAYLEMAQEAMKWAFDVGAQGRKEEKSISPVAIQLKNVVWISPIVVGEEPVKVHISLVPETTSNGSNNAIFYEIYTPSVEEGESPLVHSQGKVLQGGASQPTSLTLADLQKRLQKKGKCPEDYYAAFQTTGIHYGPAHQGMKEIYLGDGEVLAKLVLPSSIIETKGQFTLHPSLLDSALQASIGMESHSENPHSSNRLSLPFALESLEIIKRCTETMWAWIRYSEDPATWGKTDGHKSASQKRMSRSLDIDLYDEEGSVCMKIQKFSSRVVENGLSDLRLEPIDSQDEAPVEENETPFEEKIDQASFNEKVEIYFKRRLSKVLQLPAHRIDVDEPLETYGINSIMVIRLTNELEKTFGSLSKTLFFEYQTIREVSQYFSENYSQALFTLLNPKKSQKAFRSKEMVSPGLKETQMVGESLQSQSRFLNKPALASADSPSLNTPLDIAIIGLSGRYPQARNLEEYWQNLRDGKDCITEIPKDRWDWQSYYTEDRSQSGKHYSKWGGFIADVDQFDPLFFNISPRDAVFMDPQERLFLEHTWMALEDAGYQRDDFQRVTDEGHLASQVGVYAGVMYGEYQLFGAEESLQGAPTALGGSYASIANRVSYFFNLHGPSMTVDTMCSSSLTSLHLACQDLKLRRTDFGIAGGVNISIHPNKYLSLSMGQFISNRGHCESFGEGGDGYIPGEGVGVALLKRLADAESDGDHIYGVIKGSVINHGGKTNGYTVPNPHAQHEVIHRALKEAHIDPRTISYVEAHGTGTKLGDPIEITGLVKAFASHENGMSSDKPYCWIGSAKSNIGHCESAAGIAGVTKVLLQMQHRQIVPSLHSQTLNPNIDFEASPFVVNQELRDWEAPSWNGKTYPRIAGISSFGAGGSNAHLLIEEYVSENRQPQNLSTDSSSPLMIVLSAKTPDSLKKSAENLLKFIETVFSQTNKSKFPLVDLAYTLQVGREAMEERLGMIVTSVEDLKEKLQGFLEETEDMDDLFRGQVKRNKDTLVILQVDEDMAQTIEAWIVKGKYSQLLELWTKGLAFDWEKLYGSVKPCRMSLPTYPFAKERYWISQSKRETPVVSRNRETNAQLIHPLLQKNTSTLSEQRFSSTFFGDEFFLRDHKVNGKKVFPGVAYLEMAQEAIKKALEGRNERVQLNNVVWISPITVDEEPVEVNVRLIPEMTQGDFNSPIFYEIYTPSPSSLEAPVVHSQGNAHLVSSLDEAAIDLNDLKQKLSKKEVSPPEFYGLFQTLGIDYGPAHQGIANVYVGEREVLAKLVLPSSVNETKGQFTLHPSLLDSALQASMGIEPDWLHSMADGSSAKPALPFSLESLEIIKPCVATMWAWIRYSESGELLLDIDLCDEAGKLCVKLRGFSSRTLDEEPSQKTEKLGTVLIKPTWQEKPIGPVSQALEAKDYRVILCGSNQAAFQELSHRLTNERENAPTFFSIDLDGGDRTLDQCFTDCSLRLFESIQSLLQEKTKGSTLFQVLVPTEGPAQIFSALSGFLKTVHLEYPQIFGQVIAVPLSEGVEGLVAKLQENRHAVEDQEIRYDQGKRYIRSFEEVPFRSEKQESLQQLPWKKDGVYLITGGIGGLGVLFAKEVIERAPQDERHEMTLVLTGRSPLDNEKSEKLEALSGLGAKVEYYEADVADKLATETLIQDIQSRYGGLNGIIHSAGVIQDNFILKKSPAEFSQVLAPKVRGVVNLDRATHTMNLDFFVLFSSGSGVIGSVGQADYATANAFMDAFARYRGRMLSIDWPLWKEGGMGVDKTIESLMKESTGMVAMETHSGLEAFYQVLASQETQVIVMEGELRKLYAFFRQEKQTAEVELENEIISEEAIDQGTLKEKAETYFKKQLSKVLQLPMHRIEVEEPLETYGIDSVMVVQLTNELEKTFGALSKTLFFEYQTIREISHYFIDTYRNELLQRLNLNETRRVVSKGKTSTLLALSTPQEAGDRSRGQNRFLTKSVIASGGLFNQNTPLDIAIIGLSGRYPQAGNLEEYWQNLRDGKDCITEIPQERWDWQKYFTEDRNQSGKHYSKWGGFIAEVDQFDPLFFNISPRDAVSMDPQERLFLEHTWAALEDAGYRREDLQKATEDPVSGGPLARQVGVYAGVMYGEYQLFGAEESLQGAPTSFGGSYASIANRVSYFFNLHGPSMTMDTMCSSSLTTLHLACQDLRFGRTALGIAGGVNVSIHPNKYLALSMGQFISSRGHCESFGEGGDGYIPGEGVGVAVLKRLAEAKSDGDHIYGVIKGSVINHGGKTNGYTVPNPKAQQDVIFRALKEAQIDPRTVSYVEAHGTGTKLGDPIEITGLAKAFVSQKTEAPPQKQYCWIGSAKSNIGHCESAAGIAGVTKVLLQMQHKQIVPSLHSQTLNPNIDFEATPFMVNQELREWTPPILNGKTYPRIAGVSSFGAGGSNAHVLIEEFIPENQTDVNRSQASLGPQMVVLSAKNQSSLKKSVENLLTFIEAHEGALQLVDLAYTLQIGREAMEERLGVIVHSVEELKEKLTGFLEDREGIDELYLGQVKRNKDTLVILQVDEDMAQIIEAWIAKGKYSQLLELWVKGLAFDWRKVYGRALPRRMSLPTYPFMKERCWPETVNSQNNTPLMGSLKRHLHPLLQENTSTFSEQCFSSIFTGEEFFLRDHQVNGEKVLPGIAYLEMAHEAIKRATTSSLAVQLKNVVWIQPILVKNEPVEVNIGLVPETTPDDFNSSIFYEIATPSSDSLEGRRVHSQGKALLLPSSKDASLNLTELKEKLSLKEATPQDFYEMFQTTGIHYGPAYQGIEKVYMGEREVLAKLVLPPSVNDTKGQFTLHPSLLDSALQASMGLDSNVLYPASGSPSLKLSLPFSLDSLEIIEPCTNSMWAWIRHSEENEILDGKQKPKAPRLDIDLCDDTGTICLKIRGFTTRPFEENLPKQTEKIGTLLIKPDWREKPLGSVSTLSESRDCRVFLCGFNRAAFHDLGNRFNDQKGNPPSYVFIDWESQNRTLEQGFTDCSLQLFESIQTLLKEKSNDPTLIQIVVPAEGPAQIFSGLSGLLKTVHLEYPKIFGQVIAVPLEETVEGLVDILQKNCQAIEEQEIRYENGKRFVCAYEEVPFQSKQLESPESLPWKNNGVYLITGGVGGLGFLFAKEILEQVQTEGRHRVSLILTGRSPLSQEKSLKLQALERFGAQVEYQAVDVSDKPAVEALIQDLQKRFGGLNGVIHSAGVIQDNFISKKSSTEFAQVLAPKVQGVMNLDHATQSLDLDFFILFSSGAGVTGSVGQADYATGNAFMDAFARYRKALWDSPVKNSKEKPRSSHILSINWPLWKNGGMEVDEAIEAVMKENTGMVAMETASGLESFYHVLASQEAQVIVMEGELKKLYTFIGDNEESPAYLEPIEDSEEAISESSEAEKTIDQATFKEKVEAYFKKQFSKVLHLPAHRIEVEEPLETYGIDSIMVIQLTNELEKVFGSLPKTLFFEYQTILEISHYFLETYRQELLQLLNLRNTKRVASSGRAPVQPRQSRLISKPSFSSRHVSPQNTTLDIAIVGLSGRYPQARNLEEYWNNLREGKDCITEIPKDRWDWQEYYTKDRNQSGKHYSKWGGFISEMDQFDPLFFNISPRDAVFMDPQERLFLEHTWIALEDAGYRRDDLQGPSECPSTEGHLTRQVGVYAGVMYGEYQLFGAEESLQGNPAALGGSYASIANRVSYFFNFHGPSMTLDTMCSSSLTTLHLACQDLKLGRTDLGIAGGVNVSIHPNKYLGLSMGQFISSRGHCESFGDGGDGYIPGEGVGVAVLKRLSEAERDGDHVYGVIKGSVLNHGGKTNGYTVPNPKAQQEVIYRALQEAQIDPRTISYVEAHGTGTKLGDPIEIAGLTKAFASRKTNETPQPYCWIGSAKSNIGHCESAAGIAGVSKVLLQMQHKQIVPSLHSQSLNPNIDFEATPFIVNQELREWNPPVLNGKTYPRIAGVSSFGAGGSNAHVLIEEYLPVSHQTPCLPKDSLEPLMIVLSAKNSESLKKYAEKLLKFIEVHAGRFQLADLAYTLQVGREPMEERLGILVHSVEELKEKLKGVLEENEDIEELYLGHAKQNKGAWGIFQTDEDLSQTIETWVAKGKYSQLLELWVKGLAFDWNTLYGANQPMHDSNKPRRISAPTYPFAKKRYWFENRTPLPKAKSRSETVAVTSEKQWLFLEEQWSHTSLASHDWQTNLQAYAGKEILIVYSEKTDFDSFFKLLSQVKQKDGLSTPQEIRSISIEELTPECFNQIPEIVFFLASTDRVKNSDLTKHTRMEAAFKFSQFLMKKAWDTQVEIYYLYESFTDAPSLDCQSLSGFLRSAMLENPLHIWKVIGYNSHDWSVTKFQVLLQEWLASPPANSIPFIEVRYQNSQRFVSGIKETSIDLSQENLFKPRGVYLITGGLGPIGELLCEKLATNYQAHLVILSRSAIDETKKEKCLRLEALGAKVDYFSVDITNQQQLEQTYSLIKQHVPEIHGVILLANLVQDGIIATGTWNSFQQAIRPKIDGSLYLDQLTAKEPLDFFMFFSSMAFWGIAGSSAYAYSSNFQNAFARHRNHLQERSERSGRAISLCWGPWVVDYYLRNNMDEERYQKFVNQGTALITIEDALPLIEACTSDKRAMMGVISVSDYKQVNEFYESKGSDPTKTVPSKMGDSSGIATLEDYLDLWEKEAKQGIVITPEKMKTVIAFDEIRSLPPAVIDRLHRLLYGSDDSEPDTISPPVSAPVVTADSQTRQIEPKTDGQPIETLIKEKVSEVLNLTSVDNDETFQNYGLDSITGMQLATRLEKSLNFEIEAQWLLEFPTVQSLSQHLKTFIQMEKER